MDDTGLISIHAPRTGSDPERRSAACPRSISIHAPRTGSDQLQEKRDRLVIKFQSTLPVRGATTTSALRTLWK